MRNKIIQLQNQQTHIYVQISMFAGSRAAKEPLLNPTCSSHPAPTSSRDPCASGPLFTPCSNLKKTSIGLYFFKNSFIVTWRQLHSEAAGPLPGLACVSEGERSGRWQGRERNRLWRRFLSEEQRQAGGGRGGRLGCTASTALMGANGNGTKWVNETVGRGSCAPVAL